jgi:hypothetical protein
VGTSQMFISLIVEELNIQDQIVISIWPLISATLVVSHHSEWEMAGACVRDYMVKQKLTQSIVGPELLCGNNLLI